MLLLVFFQKLKKKSLNSHDCKVLLLFILYTLMAGETWLSVSKVGWPIKNTEMLKGFLHPDGPC